MSRIGRKPVVLPKGVSVTTKAESINVKGPKGELSKALPDGVTLKVEGDKVVVNRADDSRQNRAKHGLVRAHLQNMVKGVSDGFTINLEINGVGYRAAADAKNLKLQLGFSHDVEVPIPQGIQIKATKPTEIEITGADRQRVGQIAAEIRSLRPPEPYKGKGIKYSTETIRRKEGKKK